MPLEKKYLSRKHLFLSKLIYLNVQAMGFTYIWEEHKFHG